MKKILSLTITFLMLFMLFGCSNAEQKKVFDKVVFKSSNVKCEIIDDTNKELEYDFITSEKELKNYSEKMSKICSLDTMGANGSFNDKIKVYNDEFFKSNYVLMIKRYHTTNEALTFDKIDYKDKLFSISGILKTGGESDNSFRIYMFEMSRDYFVKDAKAELSVSEDNLSAIVDKSMIMSKGKNNYKLIPDEKVINEVLPLIAAENFKQKEISTDDYNPSENDISIMYNGKTALLTNKFAIIDSVTYSPNIDINNKLLEIYNKINYETMTFEAPLEE
ncbi:MAG: hypothetical protein RR229_01675 [Oscillospiraceae bacterium]